MKTRELANFGIPRGATMKLAQSLIARASGEGWGRREIRARIQALADSPRAHVGDPQFGDLARALVDAAQAQARFVPRAEPAPYRQWGENLDENSVEQMRHACRLPVAVRGALMPDAHLGYGLPIGGVLATKGAVIPYAVGVDIACRMKMTVLDLPLETIDKRPERLRRAIEKETRFGIGSNFKKRRRHPVLDEDWTVTEVTRKLKDKAWAQLGTSGSGNHFVEFGVLTVERGDAGIGPGTYLALLSHSGSRGTGAKVCDHYSRVAMDLHPELPGELRHLAWLDLDGEPGQEYWKAMNLMGRYAAANHACIHRHVAEHLGVDVLLDVENHHNFAWKETHDGEDVIVHRKGATPAAPGDLGIIPGSMASPAFLVRGKGGAGSLDSASHGAGRVMSRTQAKKTFRWRDVMKHLEERNVELMSAGLDEVPMVYKDIHEVMAAQEDLVEILARFDPRLVKMAPAGERPED